MRMLLNIGTKLFTKNYEIMSLTYMFNEFSNFLQVVVFKLSIIQSVLLALVKCLIKLYELDLLNIIVCLI